MSDMMGKVLSNQCVSLGGRLHGVVGICMYG